MGMIFVWGQNKDGKLGLNDTKNRNKPVELVSDLFKEKEIVEVAAGVDFSAILTKCGKVFTWGGNSSHQLGYETEENNSKIPKLVLSLLKNKIVTISCGSNHTLVITVEGIVFSWGYGESGQLGNGLKENKLKPQLIKRLKDVKSIACGVFHSLFLNNMGKVYSCGLNGSGVTGLNKTDGNQLVPVEIVFDKIVIKIDAFHSIAMALTEDNEIFRWGCFSKEKIRRVPFEIDNSSFKEDKIVSFGCSRYNIHIVTESGKLFRASSNSKFIPKEVSNLDILILSKLEHSLAKRKRENIIKVTNISKNYKFFVFTVIVNENKCFTFSKDYNAEDDNELKLLPELNEKAIKMICTSAFHTIILTKERNKNAK